MVDIGGWSPVKIALQDLVIEGQEVAEIAEMIAPGDPNEDFLQTHLEQAQRLLKQVTEHVDKYKEMSPYIRFFWQMFAQRRLVEEINRQTQDLQEFRRRAYIALDIPSRPENEDLTARINNYHVSILNSKVIDGDVESVKLLLKGGYDVTRADSEGRTPLHWAAIYGYTDVLDVLLEDVRCSIDAPDDEGMPPLYYAAVDGHLDIVKKLLLKNANLNTNSPQGRSVLSYIFSLENLQDIAEELVKKQASLAANTVDQRTLRLIMASASGDEDKIKTLLGEGVDVNDQDEFGYNALYEAARFGHHKIVELLIRVGANPNARAGPGGDTALHGTIDKGHICQRLIQPFRDQHIATTETSTAGALTPEAPTANPEAREDYEKVIGVLLRYGVQTEVERWDGLTATDLIVKLLGGDQVIQSEREILEALKTVLENPPAVTRKTPPEQWRPSPQILSWERRKVCQGFKTIVQYHRNGAFRHHSSTVDKLIYRTEENEVDKYKKFETWAAEKDGQWWKWVHLPANNKRWAKDLVRVLFKDKDSAQSWDLEAFIDDSYQEVRGTATYARYRRPSFQRKSDDTFSLVIPYISTDSIESLNPSVTGPRVPTTRQSEKKRQLKKKQRLEEAYRHGRADAEDLHLACTLDQSYYTSLDNSGDRDKDQVVYRFHVQNKDTEKNNGSRPIPGDPKIVMVSQLWLWRIDINTIITAFPNRWHNDQTPDVLGHIVGRIWDFPPSSLDQMIFDIIRQCVGFVDAPTNAGLNWNLFTIFEKSISKVASREASSYRIFRTQHRLHTNLKHEITSGSELTDTKMTALKQALSEAEELMCDISQEVGDLIEIRDICDELKMIQRVLQDQEDIIKTYYEDVAKKSHEGKGTSGEPKDEMGSDILSGLSLRRSIADRLYKEAEQVEVSLKNLMDMKQRQGNLNGSRDTARLAAEAEKRQLESEEQSRLLFIFTAVTVIFTPMSFTASFFAIPSSDFPRDGSNVTWTWWQICVGLLITVCATILVAAILFWIRRGSKGVGKSSWKPSNHPTTKQDGTHQDGAHQDGARPRPRISSLGLSVQNFMIDPLIDPLKNFVNYSLRSLGPSRKRETNEALEMEEQRAQA